MIERRRRKDKLVWRVRWCEPDGKERSKTFTTQRAARTFEGSRQAAGEAWVSPQDSNITLSVVWGQYVTAQSHLKASTLDDYVRVWANHIEPQFGEWPVGRIGHNGMSQ